MGQIALSSDPCRTGCAQRLSGCHYLKPGSSHLVSFIKKLRASSDTAYQVTVRDEIVAERGTSSRVRPGEAVKQLLALWKRSATKGRMRGDAGAMTTIKELISRERLQYQVLLGMSLGAVGLTGILYGAHEHVFQRFFGDVNPLAAFLVIIVLGVVLFSFLLFRGWFSIYRKENLKGLYRSAGLASIFGIIMILVDREIHFPADMNISFPASLLFYPAIGFFVEIFFHVLPLTLLLILLRTLFKAADWNRIVWISILTVSLFEPLYQYRFIGSPGNFPQWAAPYIGFHVFLINLLQLTAFKRYDFIAMYSFRLVYYLIWHIAWGYIRLRVLF